MRRNAIGYLAVLMVSVTGCGSDSPQEQPPYKDAGIDTKDASALGNDVPAMADTHDVAAPNADVIVPADTKEAPAFTDGTTNPQADTMEAPVLVDARGAVADMPAAGDAGHDAGTVDLGTTFDSLGERPILDTGAPEAGIDSSAAVGFPCRNDSDCCIEIDSCMNIAYLYSRAPGTAAPPTIQPPPGGMCTACIPPTIQVRCVSGQCAGERIAGYPAALMSGHCGYVALPDGGLTALQDVIDAGSVSTKSVWTCGG
jgi:predicted small lipoprotein YifL